MLQCDFVQLPDGRWMCQDPECGYVTTKAYHRAPLSNCKKRTRAAQVAESRGLFAASELSSLESAAGGKLLGDWIADLTTAIGIPPCGGCEKRQAWLNAAHAWLLGIAPSDPASNPPDAPQP
jgi:hypothetical protein